MVLILENLRSQYNVGSIFRSADAFGVTKILCVGYTPTPDQSATKKTSLGAEQSVAWASHGTIREAIEVCKKEGCSIVALETGSDSMDIATVPPNDQIALIVGNEVSGVSKEALEFADQIVMIPMRGTKESLNVSVAAAIALYHFTSKIV